jgi:putative ABC transport system ATP-binding protein
VSKHYAQGRAAVPAVRDISLSVPAGEFLSIMGASGSGKSTLLNLVAGPRHAGYGPRHGRRPGSGGAVRRCARSDIRLRHVGIVFQNFNLFPTFTVEENVAWPLEFYGQSARRARTRAHELLAQVGVDVAAAGRRPAELSGGEQQRVAIARALVTSPTLLLADEPTGNLDSNTGQAILDLLRRLNDEQDVTVVMVTHSTFAATYGHRTIELRDGQIVREVQTPRAAGARVIALFE